MCEREIEEREKWWISFQICWGMRRALGWCKIERIQTVHSTVQPPHTTLHNLPTTSPTYAIACIFYYRTAAEAAAGKKFLHQNNYHGVHPPPCTPVNWLIDPLSLYLVCSAPSKHDHNTNLPSASGYQRSYLLLYPYSLIWIITLANNNGSKRW